MSECGDRTTKSVFFSLIGKFRVQFSGAPLLGLSQVRNETDDVFSSGCMPN